MVDEDKNLGEAVVDRKTEQGFTPGPWTVWRLAPDSDPKERLIVTTADGEMEICGIVEDEANARLIAAAPALYEACKTMLASLDGPPTAFAAMLAAHRKLEAAVALVNKPANESAKRPISDDQQHGQAS